MKFTRRVFGETAAATAAALLAPAAALAQGATPVQSPDPTQRNWLAEARKARADSARALTSVPLPADTEPAFRFRA